MRKIIALLFFATLTLTVFSQKKQINSSNEEQKSEKGFAPNGVVYRLFPTENMWTFIKLNTRNGQMWQIQYDIEGDNRVKTDLYLVPLVATQNEMNDRFTLYPTQTFYTFILLDQLDGRVWQVQWSMDIMNRGIIPIE